MAFDPDLLVKRLREAHLNSAQRAAGSNILAEAADEIDRLRAAHQDIVRKYEKIMGPPEDWTTFTENDERLKWAREAWYGAASISRKVLEG